jgi:hypothetical protein
MVTDVSVKRPANTPTSVKPANRTYKMLAGKHQEIKALWTEGPIRRYNKHIPWKNRCENLKL